ncbi:hypothetical protein HKBW3S09_01947, partial [Candidatus Hakubella thermalkaliphila]
ISMKVGEKMGLLRIPKRWVSQEQSDTPNSGTDQSEMAFNLLAMSHSRSALERTGRAK